MLHKNRRLALSASALVIAPLLAQNPAVTVAVNATANRHPINPMVYGINYGNPTTLSDLNVPVHRLGGNNTTRYNWKLNADNRANDWYFESIGDASATAGERGDTFISMSKAAGAQPMLTIPMIGWVAKLGANRSKLASFSVAKYGGQTGTDWQWMPDAGNGIASNGQYIRGNDPNDANVPADSLYQQNWVRQIVSKWGTAANGGLKYYILDNEYSIWHSTHRDVYPTGAKALDIRDKVLDYAAKIKAVDPGALVVAPEEWGWSGYMYSGYDQQYGSLYGWGYLPDRATVTNGQDILPWLLSQWKAAGTKPVDIFSVHYYPQGGEYGNDTSSAMQLRRNRSTRSLWDPNYIDESWIGTQVRLIPRLKEWVNSYYYPGTPVAITEYNWGAEAHINGATTQADILGIFGREGLDIGTRWTTPDPSTPTYKAMKMYRNYDGSKSTFGDTSVSSAAPNPDNLSSFAAIRSGDGALTVMLVSKILSGTTPVTVQLGGFTPGGSAQAWQLTSANAITRLANIAVSGSSITATVPAQSITLLVIPGTSGPANQLPMASFTATPVTGTAPLAVAFNASASSDPDGSIAGYAWTFGDGGTATGATTSHTYSTAGTYTSTLRVTDNAGAVSTAAKTITITPPPVSSACTVTYAVTNDWGNGFQASVTVRNNANSTINNWNLVWQYAGTQRVYQLWNGNYSQSGQRVSVTGASWNASIAKGASVNFGFNANYSGTNSRPTAFTLNGTPCQVN